ncbi:carboxypeptidase-like regulatory domain-containing protein [Flavicella sediminum]|uniref:carboxypeptidase-like regulatory domain-containing protein n=1 Tax=Flavicella sediminum TaxID=2585141 RepID=UPI001120DC4C|nr:carboxypeptidase-like regulatory domain-containing protein [Flavicella sediminum]
MKKKSTFVINGAIFCCVILLNISIGFSQKLASVQGTVIDASTNLPIPKVSVQIENFTSSSFTDVHGEFIVKNIGLTACVLIVEKEGYKTQQIEILLGNKPILKLGTLFLQPETKELPSANFIDLDLGDLQEDVDGGADNITGFLQASKDLFVRTAAFNFGQARFKIRGYDSNETEVLINGIGLNKIVDGRPQWSNWGGLNDVLRNQLFSFGMEASEASFGRLAGSTNYLTRASAYRKGSSVSYAASNGSYKGRVMASYFSGLQKKGWYFVLSASRRFAKEAYMEGTSYNANSLFTAVEKQFNKRHSLNFSAFFTPNRRGKSAPATQEVFDLKGTNYNSYWGWQNGLKRNSRIKEVVEPILMLTHYWKPSRKLKLETTFSYQFRHISNSRFGYANAPNPDPSYYKKLPSYYFRDPENPDYTNAYLTLTEFKNDGQVDWKNLYFVNHTTGIANYYLYEDRNEETTLVFKTNATQQINEHIQWQGAFEYRNSVSLNYAKVLDLFGANGFQDIDPYLEGTAQQNNLVEPNRTVAVGDDFSYKYQMEANVVKLNSQFSYQSFKFDGTISGMFSATSYNRTGFYKNGQYPENSLGKGSNKKFLNANIKTSGLYKISGRKLLSYNLGYLSRAPFVRNTYANIRVNHDFVSNAASEQVLSGDVNFQYRASKLKSKISLYSTFFNNATENTFVYADGLRGDNADFVAQSVTGISKRNMGIEFSMEATLSSTIKVTGVAALGDYRYTNNPNLHIYSDQFLQESGDLGKAYLKNYKQGGTPQQAFSVGFEYRDPNYWWYAVNGNFMRHNYLQIAPLLRTENFYKDANGVPYLDEVTGKEISQNSLENLLKQEKFPDLFLVNAIGGKSWRIDSSYLGLFVSVNNILGEVYKTGGFEQSRNANVQKLIKDTTLETPLFGNKYWYGYGTTYYVILSYRF